MPVKVSVIIPVYNPGPYIEDCVGSMLRQSLPPDEFEVILVDDGSTDGTPARLDELAAEHAHIQVVHQENSGWSGKPRNVGIDASKGEYVMFVDNDDYLGDEALERMYDYGVANDADVVVGKMAGKGRGVPVELFRVNRPHANVENAPLIDSLTPHKMVRRAFLERTGLRFPEGRRRLEDHVFVTEAYLRADNVSVLSDYVCYYHIRRDDGSNAGFQRFDPVGYFKNLREALDVVERYTEPGPLRDRLFRRWLRVEMVERLSGRRMRTIPDEYRRELYDEIRGVVLERFGPGVDAGLRPAQRIVTALVRADRYDDLRAFAERQAAIAPAARPTGVAWAGEAVRVTFDVEYLHADTPMTFPEHAESPEGTPEDLEGANAWLDSDAVARFGDATADLLVRERSTSAQYFQPVTVDRETVPSGEDGRVRLVLHVTADIDPATAAGGAPLGAGLWDTYVRVGLGSWTKDCRLGPDPSPDRPEPHAGVVGGRVVLPYWTNGHHNFSLDVDRAGKRLGIAAVTPEDVRSDGPVLGVPLPLHVATATPVELRLTAQGVPPVDVPATLSPGDGTGEGAAGRATLTSELPVERLKGATWRASVCLVPDAPGRRRHALTPALRVTASGVRAVRPPAPAAGGAQRPGLVRRVARRLRRTLRSALGR